MAPKQDVNRTRENNDPAAFSDKPQLDEKHGAGLRGQDKQQGDLRDKEKAAPEQGRAGAIKPSGRN